MTSQVHRLDTGTIEITLSFPWPEVQKAKELAIADTVKVAKITGFRPGRAPRSLVEPNLDQSKLYSQAVQKLVPPAYQAALKEHNLKPIVYPSIRITQGEPNTDWTFIATTCEAPSVVLPTLKSPNFKSSPDQKPEAKLEAVLAWLRTESKVSIPDLLAEQEANHRLSRLVENVSSLGLSTEAYLKSKNLDVQGLKAQTMSTAKSDLATEFILLALQKQESLPNRQKVLDFLASL